MQESEDLAALRQHVSELAKREGSFLSEAFALSRSGGAGDLVDSLFAKVQSIQIERSALKKRIGQLLGTRRLHLASEVWQPGAYEYAPADGGASIKVLVVTEPLGLYVAMPDGRTVRITALEGTFDGPFGDDARTQR